MVNDFPYDQIAKTHHMLVPFRHVTEDELTKDETEELKTIKKTLINSDYDCIIQSTRRSLSIPKHFHLQLIEVKEK